MSSRITDTQKEILRLYLEHGLNQKQIAELRQTSKAAVSKVISKLRKLGFITDKKYSKNKGGVVTPSQPITIKWRFHALQLEMTPYYFTRKYERTRKELGNTCIPFGNFNIALYPKKVLIWLRAGIDYCDTDKYTAVHKANQDFLETLPKIEQRLGFRVRKDQKANIRILKQHLALANSDFSKVVETDYISIKGGDGKVWFIIDRSKGLREHEYVHKDRLLDDSDTLEIYLNDLRDNNPLTNSQLASRLSDLITAVEKLSEVVERRL